METDELVQYGLQYPNLCLDLVNYFADSTKQSMYYKILVQHLGDGLLAKTTKSSLDFANSSRQYINISRPHAILSSSVISKICDILCKYDILSKVQIGGMNLILNENFYYRNGDILESSPFIQSYLNNIVYGFKYIYETNKKNVLPLYVYSKKYQKHQIGSCFKTIEGIITAKHCIENQDYIQIDGIKAEDLDKEQILINENLDLALFKLKNDNITGNYLRAGKGNILDEIMVMGYPNHAGFSTFLTATTGQIAGIEKSYLCNHKLMLLTGKIKGGNSGGPVLNRKGEIVGIITEIPETEGEYDQFGYGLAIPSSYIAELKTPFQQDLTFVNDINACPSL